MMNKKLLSLKFLSQIPKSSINSHSHCFKFRPFHYSLSRAATNPITQPKTHFLSPLHQWQTPKMHYGFISKPVLAKHLVSTAHLKGSINSFVGSRAAMVRRTHFPKAKPSPRSSSQNGSWSSWSQRFSSDSVVLGLIVANSVVFVLWHAMDKDFMFENFTVTVENFKNGRVHTLITSSFSHIDKGLLFSYMINLFCFANTIGTVFGPEYLLKLYFSGAVVGSVFHLVYHAFLADMFKKKGTFSRDSSKVPALGASGPVNATMLLYIFLFPKATLKVNFLIPVPAKFVGIFLLGIDVLRVMKGDPHISGAACLGGGVVAVVGWLRLKRAIRL